VRKKSRDAKTAFVPFILKTVYSYQFSVRVMRHSAKDFLFTED
jgi:hypothetical protein